MEYIKICNLVILDESGYIPLDKDDAIKIYNIINMINKVTPLIVITNREFTQWKNIFYDEVLASTIIDRLIVNSLILNIKCESYRLTNYKKSLE